MDPPLDPPPLADQPTAALPSPAAVSPVANPTPAHAPAHTHTPYYEMISAAITALDEPGGSSKRAIAKHIEAHYPDLPPTHDALLTHHLKRLKINGQVLMVKHSYKLPRSVPSPSNGAVNAVPSDPASSGVKRRPGRPPKLKPDSVHVAVPVFEPPININALPISAVLAAEPTQPQLTIEAAAVPATLPAPVAPVAPVAAAASASGGQPSRGRGRPPKSAGLKRGPSHPPASGVFKRGRGRPPKSVSGPSTGGPVKRGRGRPKLTAAVPFPAPVLLARKGRGRPPKRINVVAGVAAPGAVGGGVAPVAGKRRGRPPRVGGEAKRPRNVYSSGKPVGRPKKNASATPVNRSPESSHLLVAYLDLKAKLENLHSRISQTATLIRPSLTNEAEITALHELEVIANNAIAPPTPVQNQPPQPNQEPQQVASNI